MGKKSRKKRLKRENRTIDLDIPLYSEMTEDGLHALMPGLPPSKEKLDEMSKLYQENIRNSPIWDEMVEKYGKNKAEEMLKEFRVELRS